MTSERVLGSFSGRLLATTLFETFASRRGEAPAEVVDVKIREAALILQNHPPHCPQSRLGSKVRLLRCGFEHAASEITVAAASAPTSPIRNAS